MIGTSPNPEPDAVTKKKKTKKLRVLSSAARIKLIKNRHKAFLNHKKWQEGRMDGMYGTEADAEDWSEDQ